MKTIIVWYRIDLRVHDHPALHTAIQDADNVIPVFIFDENFFKGKFASPNRSRFLLECLKDLKQSLQDRGGNLVVATGSTEKVLLQLAKDYKAEAVYCTGDYVPYALKRDKHMAAKLDEAGVAFRTFPGRLIVSTVSKLNTKSGQPYKVFSPFYKNWLDIQRRELAPAPRNVSLPSGITVGSLPALKDLVKTDELSPDVMPGGETEARKRFQAFCKNGIDDYKETNNDLGADATSRLSPYFHFGCLSPLELETLIPNTAGARSWRRQLCWRDFYHYVIYNFPDNADKTFQERYRSMKWDTNPKALHAWKEGQTGYPVVDAAMRQLKQEGWMHNRGRLIVGAFFTKDLWLNWQDGEAYFMQYLLDGDQSNNNGNWQWIASVGVDPAPVFRRMYNPSSQQKNYDPEGRYVRKYVPELKDVPDKYLAEPWNMPDDVQKEAGCIIGKDYPEPIVDHKAARQAALDHFRNAS